MTRADLAPAGEGAPPPAGSGPAGVDLLVVASWYPSIEDTTSGRFVADQVEALAGTGRVAPRVISFDPVRVGGLEPQILRATAVARAAASRAHEDPDRVWQPAGWAAPRVPTAHLVSVDAGSVEAGPLHAVAARRAALEAFHPRIERPGRVVVHAHTIHPDGIAAAGLADRLGAPLVITEHAHYLEEILQDPGRRRAARAAVEQAAATIAVGEDLAAQVRRLAPAAADRIRVIPNAVPMAHLRPTPRASRRHGELLYLGYRTEKKGIEQLLRAFDLVRREQPEVRLRLVGRSPSPEVEARWHALARELGVAEAVSFDPPAMRRGVGDALMTADILVHASRMETFGIAVVEALATGMPVVATATDGVRETFEGSPQDLGELVPVDDVEGFAAGVLEVLGRRDAFVPERLREAVEERFGAPRVAARLADVYEEVLGRASAAGAPPPRIEAGAADRSSRTLLVALDAGRVSGLLRQLPDASLRDITLLTADGPGSDRLPTALGAVARVDVDGAYRAAVAPRRGPPGRGLAARAARALLDPARLLRRRRARARRVTMRAEAARVPVRTLLAADGASPEVVCLGGLDHLVMEPLFASGPARPAPGGVRWLADRVASDAGWGSVAAGSQDAGRGSVAAGSRNTDRPVRVALYATADLNVIDGSAIWLESTAALLARVPGVSVTVIQHAPDIRPFVTARLRATSGIRLVRPPWPLADPRGGLTPGEALDLIEDLDAVEPFDVVIVRGFEACGRAVDRAGLGSRLWSTYVLEPERDLGSPAHVAELRRIVRASARVVVQSTPMGALFARHVPEVTGRVLVLPPGVPPEEIAPAAADPRERLVYAGKFHPFYAIEMLVATFTALRGEHPALELHVAGDKFMTSAGDPGFRDRARRALVSTPGVTWHGGLDRGAVAALLRAGGIALSVWDRAHGSSMNDLVVSTKLLDYCAAGIPVVVTRTEMQAELLGADYPLFVDEPRETIDVLRRLLADPAGWREPAERALAVARRYSYDRIAADLLPEIAAARAARERPGILGPTEPVSS